MPKYKMNFQIYKVEKNMNRANKKWKKYKK